IKNIFFLSANLCFTLILISALTEKSIINRILTFAPLRIIGIISYPFFLFNVPIRNMAMGVILFSWFDGFGAMIGIYIISLIGCISISIFLWKYVENFFNPKKKGMLVLRR
ncbi:MAG: hypothetical protein ABID61_06765, partial [Candidatus Micrarchaeota archaeon]